MPADEAGGAGHGGERRSGSSIRRPAARESLTLSGTRPVAPERSGPPRIIGPMSAEPFRAPLRGRHHLPRRRLRDLRPDDDRDLPRALAGRRLPLLLYHEGFEPPAAPGRIEAHDLMASCPAARRLQATPCRQPAGQRPAAALAPGASRPAGHDAAAAAPPSQLPLGRGALRAQVLRPLRCRAADRRRRADLDRRRHPVLRRRQPRRAGGARAAAERRVLPAPARTSPRPASSPTTFAIRRRRGCSPSSRRCTPTTCCSPKREYHRLLAVRRRPRPRRGARRARP